MLPSTTLRVLSVLVVVAKAQQVISYPDLSERCGGSRQYTRWLFSCLDLISKHSYDRHGIFLSAIVGNPDSGPGSGFAQVAGDKLGLNWQEIMKSPCFIDGSIRAVHSVSHENLDSLLV